MQGWPLVEARCTIEFAERQVHGLLDAETRRVEPVAQLGRVGSVRSVELIRSETDIAGLLPMLSTLARTARSTL